MVSIVGSAVLLVAIASLCSIAFSRYANFRKRRRGANSGVDDVPTGLPEAENLVEDPTSSHVVSTSNQHSLPGTTTSQKAPSPSACKPRTHRRSRHLISYTEDSDDESRAGHANDFTWKHFFLPARHIAFRRRDSESAVGEGYKLDSLSVSPSRPVVFGNAGDEKDGADRASMCVVLTPPSPEVQPCLSAGDNSIVEEARLDVENGV